GGEGGRGEEHVDRWPVPVDRRSALQRHAVALAVAMDPHVAIPWRDEGVAWPEAVAILRLLDPDGTEPVTPLGEGPRELFGHVLDDDEPRRVGRHRHEERLNRLGATGRRPHGDHALGGPRPPGRGRVRLSPKR